MNWLHGKHYDYPDGFPTYCRGETIWWELDADRMLGKQDEIPKEFRRRRWVPGNSVFKAEDGERLKVDWGEVSPIPMRTIRWILATDTWLLNRLKREGRQKY